MSEELLGRALPKWPQMKVAGDPVTVEQAKGIIRRTDSFFLGASGNDREWVKAVTRAMRLPPSWFDLPEDERTSTRRINEEYLYRDRWREKWGTLVTNYVGNDWISCSFVGGPHGWMRPNGTIGYLDNVGKWPGVGDIFEDWKLIASTWPFLKLGVTLMSGESCEDDRVPVVSMRVQGGQVELVDPEREDVLAGFTLPEPRDFDQAIHDVGFLPSRIREHGIPSSWIEEWAVWAESLMGDDFRETFAGVLG